MIEVGHRFRDYEVSAKVRSGGMGTLFLGRRTGAAGFSRPVAIKVIRADRAADARYVEMFLDEARLCARLSHPNIVHVEDFGEEADTYFMVMEYVHGCSLRDLLEALAAVGRTLGPVVATHIAVRVAEALQAAHGARDEEGRSLGIVHRDVSPENLLLAYTGHVKLIDFGVAGMRRDGGVAATGDIKGKAAYMAPEQATGQAVDARADLYALGVVLWEMLTGQPLVTGISVTEKLSSVCFGEISTPSSVNPAVPTSLDAVVMRLLAHAADERPSTAADARRMLTEAVPQAASLAADELSALLTATVRSRFEERERNLPKPLADEIRSSLRRSLSSADLDRVRRTMTVIAKAVPDVDVGVLAGVASEPANIGEVPAVSSRIETVGSRRQNTNGPLASSTPRWTLAVIVLVVVAAVVGASIAWINRGSADSQASDERGSAASDRDAIAAPRGAQRDPRSPASVPGPVPAGGSPANGAPGNGILHAEDSIADDIAAVDSVGSNGERAPDDEVGLLDNLGGPNSTGVEPSRRPRPPPPRRSRRPPPDRVDSQPRIDGVPIASDFDEP